MHSFCIAFVLDKILTLGRKIHFLFARLIGFLHYLAHMKKILFLHGFFATGSCPMAKALKEAFEGTAVVLTPDLPLYPKEAMKEIRSIIDREQPDLLLGNSCGAFLAQMLAPVVGIPALLGSLTIATHIIRIVCGDFLAIRTPWLTSPLSSWSTTIEPSISLAVIRLRSKR